MFGCEIMNVHRTDSATRRHKTSTLKEWSIIPNVCVNIMKMYTIAKVRRQHPVIGIPQSSLRMPLLTTMSYVHVCILSK